MDGLADLGSARVAEIDSAGMFAEVAALPRQLLEGYAGARERLAGAFFGTFPAIPPAEPDGLVICGMGGSAIGADLVLACLPGLSVPSAVVRGYSLPDWVGLETLVVVVSYSGETEEALACAAQARSRGCAPVCVSSGGRLAAFADGEGLPLVVVPGGSQPRAAVGSLSMPVLATLEAAGLCHEHATEVAAAAAQLEDDAAVLGPECADDGNPAKTLARRLEKRLVVAYGAGPTSPVARRWKGQINENAKAPAFFNELPELDHNELVGWTSLPHVTSSTIALFLLDESGEPRLARRAELTAREYETLGVSTELVAARGDSRLARLFSLVQLGDYVSCYLAVLYGVDPTPVDAIQAFKASLVGGAG
jgi:glucose/mannose-6-phosphate isomerase